MTPAEVVAVLEQQFGGRIKSKKLDALDPFVVVEATDLFEVCGFLRDDPRLKFEFLNCISGVYFTGHPNLTRILLAEDWVGHPLRKDYEYPLEYHGIRGR